MARESFTYYFIKSDVIILLLIKVFIIKEFYMSIKRSMLLLLSSSFLLSVPFIKVDAAEKENYSSVSSSIKQDADVNTWLPDKGIQQAVRKELNLSDDENFTPADLKKITKLNLQDVKITSFKGTEYLTNLEELNIENCDLSSIDVSDLVQSASEFKKLANLKVVKCEITSDMIKNITSNSLVKIDLSHNKLTNMDFAKTAKVPNMESLNVSDNQISNIEGVKGLANKYPKLVYWNGDNNQIHDYSPLIGYSTRYTDYGDYAHGRDQVIDKNITLTKPDKNDFTYDIDNIVETTGYDFDTGKITKIDSNNLADFKLSPENEDSDVYTFGDNYSMESNKLPLVVKDKDNLPNNISLYFNGSYGQENGIVNYHINWKDAVPAKQGKVTAKYVDTDGKTIAADKVLTGDVDTAYQTEKQSIDGYTFKEIQGNATGKYTEADQAVTYVYTKDAVPAKQGKVTAKYVDTDSKTIAADKVLTGDIDTSYQTEKQSIDGYTLKEIQGEATGKYTEADQTVTYVYTKDAVPAKQGKVTAKYVDTDGKTIATDKVITGDIDTAYQTEKQDIDGYTFKEIQGEATGKYTEADQTVTYVYAKQANSKPTPNEGGNKQNNADKPGQSNSQNPKGSNKQKQASWGDKVQTGVKKLLPNTGTKQQVYLSVLGVVILGTVGYFFIKKRK